MPWKNQMKKEKFLKPFSQQVFRKIFHDLKHDKWNLRICDILIINLKNQKSSSIPLLKEKKVQWKIKQKKPTKMKKQENQEEQVTRFSGRESISIQEQTANAKSNSEHRASETTTLC